MNVITLVPRFFFAQVHTWFRMWWILDQLAKTLHTLILKNYVVPETSPFYRDKLLALAPLKSLKHLDLSNSDLSSATCFRHIVLTGLERLVLANCSLGRSFYTDVLLPEQGTLWRGVVWEFSKTIRNKQQQLSQKNKKPKNNKKIAT